ncbi:hypothetical protein [Streptomyces fuscichromogenes]|uniref:hypothetical protein n=1 Tax=Streptomyces fuscichromogenes TaxID=1324013 RepID=UPI001670AA15|nr:hypothetical protein [Streptomyces fuscichromogenes]
MTSNRLADELLLWAMEQSEGSPARWMRLGAWRRSRAQDVPSDSEARQAVRYLETDGWALARADVEFALTPKGCAEGLRRQRAVRDIVQRLHHAENAVLVWAFGSRAGHGDAVSLSSFVGSEAGCFWGTPLTDAEAQEAATGLADLGLITLIEGPEHLVRLTSRGEACVKSREHPRAHGRENRPQMVQNVFAGGVGGQGANVAQHPVEPGGDGRPAPRRGPSSVTTRRRLVAGSVTLALAAVGIGVALWTNLPSTGASASPKDPKSSSSPPHSPPPSTPPSTPTSTPTSTPASSSDSSAVPPPVVPCVGTCRDIKLGGSRQFDIETWGAAESGDLEAATQNRDDYRLRPRGGARLAPFPGGGELDAAHCPKDRAAYFTDTIAAPPMMRFCLFTAEGTRVMFMRQDAYLPYRLFRASVLTR